MVSEMETRQLDQSLEKANRKYIKLNDEETKRMVQIVLEVVNAVINTLKQNDSNFKKVFTELTYCGSYFDGLRVKQADEFDMNLILDPLVPIQVQFLEGEKILLKRKPGCHGGFPDWFDNNGYLKQDEVNNWFQSIIDSSFRNTYTYKGYQLRFITAYPARTLHISSESGNFEIDVDLVPAFRFSGLPKLSCLLQHQEWVAIPKQSNWRATFPEQEKELLSNCGNLLYIGRLLKGLRQSINLNVRTYHIKTLLLYEAAKIKQQYNLIFWQKSPGYLFLYMLEQLERALSNHSLKGFWKSHEEFAQFSHSELVNMHNQVRRIRERLVNALRSAHQLDSITNEIFSL